MVLRNICLFFTGEYWKWRMQGGCITLAKQFLQHYANEEVPEIVIATDMLDLSKFIALVRHAVPVTTCFVLYCHENQLTYPLPKDCKSMGAFRRQDAKAELQFAFINYMSMLAADAVFFNSQFHMDSFLSQVAGQLLKPNRDHQEVETVTALKKKCRVLHVGIDLSRLTPAMEIEKKNTPPLIVWNQRWEYDKNPEQFVQVLKQLMDEQVAFEVAILGEQFSKSEKSKQEFEQLVAPIKSRIIHIGYATTVDYMDYLHKSTVTLFTAIHEFFGISMIECVHCNVLPVLPKRLSYPELIPLDCHGHVLYKNDKELLHRVKAALLDPTVTWSKAKELAKKMNVAQFDWKSNMAGKYDFEFAQARVQHLENIKSGIKFALDNLS